MKSAALWLIRFYQKHISHLLPTSCKFNPTCSEYTRQAIANVGVIRGIALGAWRICRCNPFSKGRWDPPPSGANSTKLNNLEVGDIFAGYDSDSPLEPRLFSVERIARVNGTFYNCRALDGPPHMRTYSAPWVFVDRVAPEE